jgi:hypothetical protein
MTTLDRMRELATKARETAELSTDPQLRALLCEIADILEKVADEGGGSVRSTRAILTP